MFPKKAGERLGTHAISSPAEARPSMRVILHYRSVESLNQFTISMVGPGGVLILLITYIFFLRPSLPPFSVICNGDQNRNMAGQS